MDTMALRYLGDNWVMETTRCIGKGSFADVYLGRNVRTNEKVAVKMVTLRTLQEKDERAKMYLAQEIELMRRLKHQNIVTLHDVIQEEDHLYMILEYCAGGDFATYLRRLPTRKINETTARAFMQQLAHGLWFLRSHNIVHRDLKPQNLLIGEETPPNSGVLALKIADFGLARVVSVDSLASTQCGSPLYMAPEIMQGESYTDKADLWSVGVILYQMLVGEVPFTAATPFELQKKIQREGVSIPSAARLSVKVTDLIKRLLNRDFRKRISWESFFAHPWLQMAALQPSDGEAVPEWKQDNAVSFRVVPEQDHALAVDEEDEDLEISTPTERRRPKNTQVSPFKSQHSKPRLSSESVNDRRTHSSDSFGDLMSDVAFINTTPEPNVTTTSPDSIKHALERQRKENHEHALRVHARVETIMTLIQYLIDTSDYDGAFLVCVKAVEVIRACVETLQSNSDVFAMSDQLGEVMQRLKARCEWCLRQINRYESKNEGEPSIVYSPSSPSVSGLSSAAPSSSSQSAPTICASLPTRSSALTIMYERVMVLGKNAVLDEYYENYTRAEAEYRDALLLLAQLLEDAEDEADRQALTEYLEKFQERRSAVARRAKGDCSRQ